MNQVEIMRLAREAGGDDWGLLRDFMPELEKFANLIEDMWMERAAILIRGEREGCAKVCEELSFSELGPSAEAKFQRNLCAQAIRARAVHD